MIVWIESHHFSEIYSAKHANLFLKYIISYIIVYILFVHNLLLGVT